MDIVCSFRETVRAYHLLADRDRVLVGLSGGPDSVALLDLLCRFRKQWQLTVSAVYINHMIRPRVAKREERFCRALCERLQVEFLVVQRDVPSLARVAGQGLEETARHARYEIFAELIAGQALDRVALGHHADDQIETVLFRLCRGTGLTGLCGMSFRRDRIIRPLLAVHRKDILEYLESRQLTWCEDNSNRSTRFARNFIRHRLLPLVRDRLNARVDEAVLRLVDNVSPEESFLETLTSEAVSKCVSTTPGGKISLDLRIFTAYDIWLRRRLIRRCLKATCRATAGVDHEVVENVDRLAVRGSGAITLPGPVWAVAERDRLFLFASRLERVSCPLDLVFELTMTKPRLWLRSSLTDRSKIGEELRCGQATIQIDADKIEPPLSVRSIRPGDRLVPLGMTGHRKVGNLLTDRKIPRSLRDEVMTVCDAHGIVWLLGIEIAERVRIDDRTNRVLTIEYGSRTGQEEAVV